MNWQKINEKISKREKFHNILKTMYFGNGKYPETLKLEYLVKNWLNQQQRNVERRKARVNAMEMKCLRKVKKNITTENKILNF